MNPSKKYIIPDHVVSNVLAFLDRVEIKGLKEVQAVNEIVKTFNTPLAEEETE